jgi:flagellar FliJ protein
MWPMSDFNSIALAVQLATRKRDELVIALANAASAVNGSLEQMGQLQRYADETDSRWIAGNAAIYSLELVKHHFQFVDRLQHAISLQGETIAQLELLHEKTRRELLDSEIRVHVLTKVLRSRKQLMQVKLSRREQRQMDEMATNQFMRMKYQELTGGTR